MVASGWFWLVLAVLIFWGVGAYRRLLALRSAVNKQFAVLEEVMLRFQGLVQEATTAAVTAPAGWQTAVAPELGASHWTRLQVAANLSAMAMARMQEHPLDPSSSIALVATSRDLQAAWENLTHPDTYYVSVPEELTTRWKELTIVVQPDIQRFNQAPQTVALWQQLQAVAQALVQVRQGTSASVVVAAVPAPLRAGVQALLFQVLRQLGRAQALRAQLAQRAPPPLADALLCAALALAWRDEGAPYAPHTLVNQAVEAAKKSKRLRAQANFLNACLRRFLRERDALVQATHSDVQAVWNHPAWWVQRLQHDHPAHWQSILQVSNQPAPMTLRVNTKKISREQLQQRWLTQGIEAHTVGEQGLVLTKPRAVQDIPGFQEGECSVQDAAAQYAAPCLLQGLTPPTTQAGTSEGLRVLDACAAPGGKTAHLLELLGTHDQVLALDIDPVRCERIAQNLQRLQLQAQVVVADAGQPDSWWDGQPFDAILLDAPCTASGIVRRHPDVRWLRRETDSAQLSQVQQRLLRVLWPLLKPGGRLLYCTCSVFKLEGEMPVKAFLQHNTDARLCPSVGHLRPQNSDVDAALADNLVGDHDGFYYALLEKVLPT